MHGFLVSLESLQWWLKGARQPFPGFRQANFSEVIYRFQTLQNAQASGRFEVPTER